MLRQAIKKTSCSCKIAIIKILLLLIFCYRYFISPILGCNCRYYPTCSVYAKEAILIHGILRGLKFTIQRLLRCHPWGSSGYDPVPNFEKHNVSK